MSEPSKSKKETLDELFSKLDDQQRAQIVKAALESAMRRISGSDITEEKIRSMLNLKPDMDILSIKSQDVRVEVNTDFGNAIFIKESGPSWVQYHDHRPHNELDWLISELKDIDTLTPGEG